MDSAKSDSAAPKRWKAFLTYAHDDNSDYIRNFYDIFTRELKRLGIGTSDEFYLDTEQNDKIGGLREYLEENASRADFLIIFVGDNYPSRSYCLYEWLAFRNQFVDRSEVRNRLLIIEIDEKAFEELKKTKIEGQEAFSNERITELQECFHEYFYRDHERVVSKRQDGALNEFFEQKVEKVAKTFAEVYRKRTRSSSPHLSPESVDVVIGLATPDIDPKVAELKEELKRLEGTLRFHAISLREWAMGRDAYEPTLRAARLVVLPFSRWHAVFASDGPEGGHLAVQRSCVAERSKVLWWLPPCGVAADGPVGSELCRESSRRHLDYLGVRVNEASQAAPEALVEEIRRRLRPLPPPSWPPQIALEIRSPYEGQTKRLQDFLIELWRQRHGDPVPEIQAAELQPTEDLADLAGVADGILLAAVGKPGATVTAQVMILKKALLKVTDEPPKWGLFAFRPPVVDKRKLEPPPPCYVLLAAEPTDVGHELKLEEGEIAELAQFLEQVRSVAELRRQNGAATGRV
jgi:hypothetical protein